MFGVFRNVDRFAVILDREAVGVADDIDLLDGIFRVLAAQTDGVVMGIHEEFIDELVESGVDCNGLGLELVFSMEEHIFSCCLDAADVGVGKGEDVLAVRLTLVGIEIHLCVRLW